MKSQVEKSFLIGVGVGHIIEKYKGDFWGGLKRIIIERQLQIDIEKHRIVDVMGDPVVTSFEEWSHGCD